ncbi:hypothetical protein PG996_005608 [Apiospora saccharicola]|uniref:ATPase AAA-type core domain-containing protein n=1 Tax=Apiospora saccharicola TaxID=335842 RepID=A0ABR1VPV6_9PEZI
MALQRAASLVGLRISRDTLVARAKQLETKLGATNFKESLEDEGDYEQVNGDAKQTSIAKSTYWCPKLKEILLAIDNTTPRTGPGGGGEVTAAATPISPSTSTPAAHHPLHPNPCPQCRQRSFPKEQPPPPPLEFVFAKEDLPRGRRDPSTGRCLTASLAGYELATYLRSQDILTLRVRPKMEPILAANLWESSLIKLMASLITNLCRLLPAAGIRSTPALSQEAFDALASGGSPGSLQAGLAILDVLSNVRLQGGADGWGWRRLVVIVDELNYAEHPTTQDQVSRFVDVLRRICATNDAPLIFTLSKPCNAVGGQ